MSIFGKVLCLFGRHRWQFGTCYDGELYPLWCTRCGKQTDYYEPENTQF